MKAELEETEADPSFSLIPLVSGGLCGGAGAGLGALIGHEAWREVPVAHSVNGNRTGVRVALTVRF
jgi:hypothetical protein